MRTSLLLIAATTCPLAVGCFPGGSDGAQQVAGSKSALQRMQSCEELTQSLQDDARAKMNARIDAEVRAIREGYSNGYYRGGPIASFGGPTNAAAPAGAPTTTGAPQAVPENAGGAADSAAPAHSETETQVKGVDEADIVKADGTRLYVLHGQKFLIVDAWPAPSLAMAGGIDVEGDPSEMFVADGKAVIFSTVDGREVYKSAGVTPRAQYSDAYATPFYEGVADIALPGGQYPGGIGYQNALTKVTVLTLSGASATVARELYFEGSYLSSRRVGAKVRLVLEGGGHGPALQYYPNYPAQDVSNNGVWQPPTPTEQIAAWEDLRTQNEKAIAATGYLDWIPTAFAQHDKSVEAAPLACNSFYVPTAGSTEFGVTQIQAFDLSAPSEAPRAVAIVGAAETVYGNANSIVLAGRAYRDPWLTRLTAYNGNTLADGTSATIPVETLNFTHLHLFDVGTDGFQPAYLASGTVPGDIKDQFALDEKNGMVRVTTTEQRSGPPRTDGKANAVSHVFVLRSEANGLSLIGDAGEIAPGEQLYATRYVGDKAYVVTWHVTDPLFVIDLANPTQPRVLGELKIPGFSEYMHPLDDTHLLTIGRETDDTGHQHTDGGYWYGISIQVFDVTNPLQPALAHKFVYDGGEYATSEATQNHKAFTYFDDRKLLAFPYVRQYGWSSQSNAGPSSTLEVFHVDVATGIQKVGSVDHSSLLTTLPNGNYGYCGGYFDGSVRRGVFFENVVYSISYGGILANDVANLAKPLGSLQLSAPTMQGLTCSSPTRF